MALPPSPTGQSKLRWGEGLEAREGPPGEQHQTLLQSIDPHE